MSPKPTNCAGCGKLFLNPGTGKYCPACKQKHEKQMDEIAAYVRDNPRSSVDEICTALEVKNHWSSICSAPAALRKLI